MSETIIASRVERPQKASRSRWNFAEWFVLSQTFLPALLYLPGSQPFRVPIRVASYGISLAALIYWLVKRRQWRHQPALHPATPWLIAALLYLALMIAHPTTNSLLAGGAQVALYLAVLAPVFWAPAFVSNSTRLRRLLWLILICNGVNSFVGVMQVRDPNVWMPREFSSVVMESEFELGTLVYEGADGNTIIRPPGLGDAPGAVCGPAVFALFLGLVFAISDRQWWKKGLALVFAALGAEAIFLSLVRSSFLIAVGMTLMFLVIQIMRGQTVQAGMLFLVGVVALTFAFYQSSKAGGDTLVARFSTIIEGDPLDFYYENRGSQISSSFAELLPKYPLGAGLGRWGMMSNYFGNPYNTAAPPIWVEIQWPAWLVDGGIILLLLYPTGIGVAMWQQVQTAFRHRGEAERELAGIILAANAGLLALCFSYPVFVAPVGNQFWFLAGALYGAAHGWKPTAGTVVNGPRVKPLVYTAGV